MKRVLTIDDSKTLRMIVGKHLRPFGLEISEAENGLIGVDVAKKEKPDLILLDYNMPVLDGYHTLVELKADPDLKPIPVIMLTTETVKETVLRLIRLGLKDYIAKPFTRDVLLQKINPVLCLYSGDTPPSDSELATAGILPSPGSVKTRIMVVADTAKELCILRECLGDKCEIDVEQQSLAAMRKLAAVHHDWLFLDLSLPNTRPVEIIETFQNLHKKSMKGKRIVGIACKNALKEILEAKSKGVCEFLLKPFTGEDVHKLIEKCAQPSGYYAADAMDEGYLSKHGNLRILSCPEANDPALQDFVQSLTTDVIKEIREMSQSGGNRLLIQLTPGAISNPAISRRFMHLIDDVRLLGIDFGIVAKAEQVRAWLAQHSETSDLPIYVSLNSAFESLEPTQNLVNRG